MHWRTYISANRMDGHCMDWWRRCMWWMEVATPWVCNGWLDTWVACLKHGRIVSVLEDAGREPTQKVKLNGIWHIQIARAKNKMLRACNFNILLSQTFARMLQATTQRCVNFARVSQATKQRNMKKIRSNKASSPRILGYSKSTSPDPKCAPN